MNGTAWAWAAFLAGWAALIAAAGWYGTRHEARREARLDMDGQDAKFCAAHDIDWHGTPEHTR